MSREQEVNARLRRAFRRGNARVRMEVRAARAPQIEAPDLEPFVAVMTPEREDRIRGVRQGRAFTVLLVGETAHAWAEPRR